MRPDASDDERIRTMTLEAFADTIVPGEKRGPDDPAIAGVATGGGAVAAGALELLADPAGGFADALPVLATMLNDHARAHAADRGLPLDEAVPPFVALPYQERSELVLILTRPGHPEKEGWVGLALFSNMAFDTAAHVHTADALAAGHPGLTAIGYSLPDADGLWRFPDYSYGRVLADTHPDTTPSGSPA